MRAVGRTNTDLELKLRRALWKLGFRYRVNVRVAATRPDIIFSRAKIAVFVDGCFWHGCPTHYVAPVGNADFWQRRLKVNKARDIKNSESLVAVGWQVLRFWGCRINKDLDGVIDTIGKAVRGREP
jgi:DNA mismatch endonuclease (patch repair protein)